MPFGQQGAYIGDVSATETVAVDLGWRSGGWGVAADSGVRFARPVVFGDTHLGTSAQLGLGVSRELFQNPHLTLAVEALARPMLVAQPPSPTGEGTIDQVVPGEWLASLTWQPQNTPIAVSLSGGTALPLSHRSDAPGWADSTFVAPSVPRARCLISLSTVWDPRPPREPDSLRSTSPQPRRPNPRYDRAPPGAGLPAKHQR